MFRRLGILILGVLALFFGTMGIANAQTNEGHWVLASTTATVDCYSVNYGHPSSPGVYSDPCSFREWYWVVNGQNNLRLAEDVKWSWVANGSDVKVNAVETVARISDVSGQWNALQVDFINAGFYNGGTLINTCNCPVNTQTGNDLLVTTPWEFGVGCGNTATGHSAGDQVWNHAGYSSRLFDNSLATWDDVQRGGTSWHPAEVRAFPSYYYFAPRSSC